MATKKEGIDGAIFGDEAPEQVHIPWEISHEAYPLGRTEAFNAGPGRILPA